MSLLNFFPILNFFFPILITNGFFIRNFTLLESANFSPKNSTLKAESFTGNALQYIQFPLLVLLPLVR